MGGLRRRILRGGQQPTYNLGAGFSASSLDRPADEADDEAYQPAQTMRALLSILMIVCLVMQATFGCCRLGCPGCADEACEFDGAPVSIASCHHEHHADSAGPCRCEAQCRGVCNYVASSKMQIEPSASDSSAAPVAVVP